MAAVNRTQESIWVKFLIVTGISLLVPIFLISCGTMNIEVVETDDIAATAVVTEEPVPVATNTDEPQEPAHKTSGLVFTNNEGTWWINPGRFVYPNCDSKIEVNLLYRGTFPCRILLQFCCR